MGFLDKLKFQAWDSVGAVTALMAKWKPKGCRTEKEFENSLYSFLHAELGDVQITKQFAQGRIRADLVIGGRVIVEVKHNLDSTAKYQRLIGQLSEYKTWDGHIVVLLTGKTDPNLRKELDGFLRREDLTGDFFGGKVAVFEK